MEARTPSKRKQGLARRLAFGVAIASFSFIAMLLAGEAAFAIFSYRGVSLFCDGRYRPKFHSRVFSPESGRVVDMRINQFGFRGPDWSIAKANDDLRLAFVGDSFVAAVAVDEKETFVDLARQPIESRIGRNCECMNFGVSGRDLADYLIHYRLFVRQFHPDVVVVCFYHGNDLRGRLPALADPKTAIDYAAMRTPDTPGLNGWLLEHSRLYNWYTATTRAARDNLREWAVRRSPDAYYRTMKERFERRWEDYRVYLDPPDEPSLACWNVIENQLAAFQKEVTADGARLLVVGIPAEEQVSDDDWQRLCHEGGREDEKGWSRLAPDRRLAQIADRNGIDFLPAMKALRSAASDDLFFGRGHLTPAGHRIVADAIADRLSQSAGQMADRRSVDTNRQR